MHTLYVLSLFYIIAAGTLVLEGTANGDNYTSLSFKLTLSNTTDGYQYKYFKKINPYNCTNDTLCQTLQSYKSWVIIQEIGNSTSLQHDAFPSAFNASYIRYAMFIFLVEQYTDKGEFETFTTWQYLLQNYPPTSKYNFPLWSILTIAAILTSTVTTIVIVCIKTRKKKPKKILVLNPAKINIIPAPEERPISSDKASNPGSIAPTIVPASNNGRSNNEEKPISISIPLADTNEQKEEPKRIEIIEMPVQLAHPQRLFDYQYTDVL